MANISKGKLTPWFTRRRTRSVGSTPFAWQTRQLCANSNLSDEICSSSTSKDKDYSNIYQSDSDDLCSNFHPVSASFRAAAQVPPAATSAVNCSVGHVMESDSFNENSPCRRSTRRKRKYKKIAMDVDPATINRFYYPSSFSLSKKKRIMRLSSSNAQNSRLCLNPGKRKRSLREKSRLSLDGSCGGGSESSSASRDAKVLGISKLSLNDYPPPKWPDDQYDSMEVSYPIAALSSSSVSSSGSETGIFTNDEGREGDDEQSDWVGEASLASTIAGAGVFAPHPENENDDDDGQDEEEDDETNFNSIGAAGKKVTDESCLRGQLLSSRVSQILCPSKSFLSHLPTNDSPNRPMRRKIRSLRVPLPIPVLRKAVTEFPHQDSDLGNEMKVTTGRRHTFSSYKRRKRIPPQTTLVVEGVSEKIPSFLADSPKLSDISSSDSKESML